MSEWRVIGPEKMDIYSYLAFEEVALENVLAGSDPIIRIMTWKGRSVSIGRFQYIKDEVELEYAYNNSIDLARRGSGGGAVYHGAGEEIIYSAVMRRPRSEKVIADSYKEMCGCIVNCLTNLGIRSRFEGPNKVMVGDLKISGNSKWLRGDAVLEHGTLLYRPDIETMSKVLKQEYEGRPRGVRSIRMPVTGIREHANAELEEAIGCVSDALLENKSSYQSNWKKEERSRSKEIIREKYGKNEWTFIL